MSTAPPASLPDRIVLALATGLGVGYLPGSPGTFGSLWGLVIAWALSKAGLAGFERGLVCLPLLLLGVPICGRAARLLGREDPGAVVYDEFTSLPLAFLLVDFSLTTALLAFVVFRVLDITKPWPIRRFERFPGGWGVMADDVVAALISAPIVWGAQRMIAQM